MPEVDREHCLDQLRQHEIEISTLSIALAGLDGGAEERYVAYLNSQVTRHRISMALLESRLGRVNGTKDTPGPLALA